VSFTLCPLDLGDVAVAECWPEDEPAGKGPPALEPAPGGAEAVPGVPADAGTGDGVEAGADDGRQGPGAGQECGDPAGPGRDRGDMDGCGDVGALWSGVLLPLPALGWEDVALRTPDETRIGHVKKVRAGRRPRPLADRGCPQWELTRISIQI
jgi:hypothetical protein